MAKRLWRRVLAGAAATVAAVAFTMFAPATANAATSQSIAGTVKEAAAGSWTLGGQTHLGAASGVIDVFTSGCSPVSTAKVSWSGTRFTVRVSKSGSYKLRYRDTTRRTTNSVPYGLAESWYGGGVGCKAAPSIKLSSGKRLTGKNLTVRAAGALQAIGATLRSTSSYVDRYSVYSAKTGQRMATLDSNTAVANLAPGGYRISLERYVVKTKSAKVLRVLGTSSTSVSRGKTVTVYAGKATQANVVTTKTATVKDFRGATVEVSGTGQVGKALTGEVMYVPAGTRIAFQWSSSRGGRIAGATKSTYLPQQTDLGNRLSVVASLSRSGYLNRVLGSGTKTVVPVELRPLVSQEVSTSGSQPLEALDATGTRLRGAKVGDTLTVTPAEFEPAAAGVVFTWRYAGAPADFASGDTLEITPSENGSTIQVTGTYSRPGSPPSTITTYVSVDPTTDGEPLPVLEPDTAETFEGDLTAAAAGSGYDYSVKATGPLAMEDHATFLGADGQPVDMNDPYCAWTWADGYDANGLLREGSCMLGTQYLLSAVGQRIRLTVTYSAPGYQDAKAVTTFLVVG